MELKAAGPLMLYILMYIERRVLGRNGERRGAMGGGGGMEKNGGK